MDGLSVLTSSVCSLKGPVRAEITGGDPPVRGRATLMDAGLVIASSPLSVLRSPWVGACRGLEEVIPDVALQKRGSMFVKTTGS